MVSELRSGVQVLGFIGIDFMHVLAPWHTLEDMLMYVFLDSMILSISSNFWFRYLEPLTYHGIIAQGLETYNGIIA
jgi:hypothetical protein